MSILPANLKCEKMKEYWKFLWSYVKWVLLVIAGLGVLDLAATMMNADSTVLFIGGWIIVVVLILTTFFIISKLTTKK
jgi:hypothetical protein